MNLYNETISPQEQERLNLLMKRLASPEFEVLRRYLKIQIAQRLDTLVSTTDPVIGFRMQGQVKAIEELLEAIEAAASKC